VRDPGWRWRVLFVSVAAVAVGLLVAAAVVYGFTQQP
jgi:ABC-type transporter Mla subunit MlaD